MGVNGVADACSYKKPHFLLQVMRESVSVLQVPRESVSHTTRHVHVTEHAMKSKVRMIQSLAPQDLKTLKI